MVYLEHADVLEFDESRIADVQVLRGNVQFRHDSAWMYCDSAYFYEGTNSFDAFGNVRFVQGDTLFGYGDVLYYDGNTKYARLRRNVRLVDGEMVLTTDSLNYDRPRDIAWYYTGGKITDSENKLTSRWGQYTSHNNTALFRGDVHLVNSKFDMNADTLKYNTSTHIADIVGPTTIVYEEETTIYSTLGWYNTSNEQSMLLNHSLIVHKDSSSLTGDTIYYDKRRGYGELHHNIAMTDSANHLTLYGHYGEMYEHGVMGKNYGYATDSAKLVDWSDSTAYTYLHADTLFTEEVPYTIPQLVLHDSVWVDSVLTAVAPDTVQVDTAYRQVRAYYSVRLYRKDLQAVADSLVMNGRDSIMILYHDPIAWSDGQQVSADLITVYTKNSEVDYVHGVGNAIAIQQKAPRFFNQLSGKECLAYVRESELREIAVNGNAETVFFPQEDDGRYIGMNKTQSSYVHIYLKDQEIQRVLFTTATTGSMYPFEGLTNDDMRLSGFFWAVQERPISPDDIFRKAKPTERPGKHDNKKKNKE